MGLICLKLKEPPITHEADCKLLQDKMEEMGYFVSLMDIHTAYTEYSDMYAAGWLFINEDELESLCKLLVDSYFIVDEDFMDEGNNLW